MTLRSCSRLRRRCQLAPVGQSLRKRGEVGLSLGEVARLKILTEFLELRLNLLEAILRLLGDGALKNVAAAGDSGDGHVSLPILEHSYCELLSRPSLDFHRQVTRKPWRRVRGEREDACWMPAL